jgi:hypothetical protein
VISLFVIVGVRELLKHSLLARLSTLRGANKQCVQKKAVSGVLLVGTHSL